ncbi:hypothetical protein LOTGIDRAFT_172581 [Lottia gigantea]|uniref:WH2 domain-containing protein n=1 Tax=Lottia gigantea TaxID=225164 RepID=V4AW29_LOTGI|nr:hypothetical protein LOTGIDRAFT_172581 [Lottia gigantea]ESP01633.1 hypothetical protein LOTGIDRAFT_172581 [Lottia gigantea]
MGGCKKKKLFEKKISNLKRPRNPLQIQKVCLEILRFQPESNGSWYILLIVNVAVCVTCVGIIIISIVIYDACKQSKKLEKESTSKELSRRSTDKIRGLQQNRSPYSKTHGQLKTVEVKPLFKKSTNPAVNEGVARHDSKSSRSNLPLKAQRRSTAKETSPLWRKARQLPSKKYNASQTETLAPSNTSEVNEITLSGYTTEFESSPTRTQSKSHGSQSVTREGGKPRHSDTQKRSARRTPREQGRSTTALPSDSVRTVSGSNLLLSKSLTDPGSTPRKTQLSPKKTDESLIKELSPSVYANGIQESDARSSVSDISASRKKSTSKDRQVEKTLRNATNMHESPTQQTSKKVKPEKLSKSQKSCDGNDQSKDISSSTQPTHPGQPTSHSHTQQQNYSSSVPPPPPIPDFHTQSQEAKQPGLESNSKRPLDFNQSIKAGVKLKPVTEPEPDTYFGSPPDFLKSIQAGVKLKPATEPGPETISDGPPDFLKSIQAGVKLKPATEPGPGTISDGPPDFLKSIQAGVKLKPGPETISDSPPDFLKSIQAGVKLKPATEPGPETISDGPPDFLKSIQTGVKLKPATEPGPETISDGPPDFLKSIQAGVKLKPATEPGPGTISDSPPNFLKSIQTGVKLKSATEPGPGTISDGPPDFLKSIQAGVKLKPATEPGPETISDGPPDFLKSIQAGVKLKSVTEPGPETISDSPPNFLKSIQAGVNLKPVVVSESTSKGGSDIFQSIKAGRTLKPVADRSLRSKPMDHGDLLSQAVLKPNLKSVKDRKIQQPSVQEETFSDIIKGFKFRKTSNKVSN